MTLGERIRKIRKKKGITQTQLSKTSGLQPSHISHFEVDRRVPTLGNFTKLVNALYCSPDEVTFLLGIK